MSDHPKNVGCCDGHGQVWHGTPGTPIQWVTVCPKGCAGKAWDSKPVAPASNFRAGEDAGVTEDAA